MQEVKADLFMDFFDKRIRIHSHFSSLCNLNGDSFSFFAMCARSISCTQQRDGSKSPSWLFAYHRRIIIYHLGPQPFGPITLSFCWKWWWMLFAHANIRSIDVYASFLFLLLRINALSEHLDKSTLALSGGLTFKKREKRELGLALLGSKKKATGALLNANVRPDLT